MKQRRFALTDLNGDNEQYDASFNRYDQSESNQHSGLSYASDVEIKKDFDTNVETMLNFNEKMHSPQTVIIIKKTIYLQPGLKFVILILLVAVFFYYFYFKKLLTSDKI